MTEKIYTIPVNEAFDTDCECPICTMYKKLETDAIEFTMGPSYMEDDVRMETNRLGFCEEHIKLLYRKQNRLGLALIMLSHMDNAVRDMEKLAKSKPSPAGLFKKTGESGLKQYADKLNESCYICNRIDNTFNRYISTVFYLYRNEDSFRTKYAASKGFCIKHYALLYDTAPSFLHGDMLSDFIKLTNKLFFDNMQRVRDDLKWFTDKFDYRYVNEPWKNSEDALPRTINKINNTTDC